MRETKANRDNTEHIVQGDRTGRSHLIIIREINTQIDEIGLYESCERFIGKQDRIMTEGIKVVSI